MHRRGVPAADGALAAVAFAVALALRWILLPAPPYGDEPLFWFGAAHPFQAPPGVTDLGGRPFEPRGLFLERPAFFAVLALPAMGGFTAFRAAAAALAALLAPAAFALVRARAGRMAAFAAGLGVAILPDLAAWGAFGLTDSLMALFLAGMVLARLHGRPGLAAASGLAAVWTKEIAYVAVVGALVVDVARDLVRTRREHGRLAWPWPAWSVPRAHRPMLLAALLGPLPLLGAFALGFPRPGVHEPGYAGRLLDQLFVTPWLLPVLAMGVALPRSRPLAAWGLAPGAFLLAYHAVLGSAVQAWYAVPSQLFAVVGVAASAAALWHRAEERGGSGAGAGSVALLAAFLVVLVAVVPSGAERAWLHPVAVLPDQPLDERVAYELEVRDRDREEAFGALPGGADLVTLGVGFPQHLHPLAQRQGHVWVVSWPTYTPSHPAGTVASHVEAEGAWTLVAQQGTALQLALLDTYSDCIVGRNAGYAWIEGAPCAGRGQRLDAAAGGALW